MLVNDIMLGNDQRAGSILVKAMNNSRTELSADTDKCRAMIKKTVYQSAGIVTRSRMNDKTRLLVHHDEIVIFKKYIDWYRFRFE